MSKIAIIGGDGVGAEIMERISPYLSEIFNIECVSLRAGFNYFKETRRNLSTEELDLIKSCDGILFGSTASPSNTVKGYFSPILFLRKELELFANVRPVQSLLSGKSQVITIIRENLEGMYSGVEWESDDNSQAFAKKVVTREKVSRLAEFACNHCISNGRKKMTIVHKANVLKKTDGMFREICLDVTSKFKSLMVNEQLVDSAAYDLIRYPEKFDTILTMNLYGDILSDVAAAVGDGLGFAGSLSYGSQIFLAEPVHGAAPDIAGLGIANPYGMVNSLTMLLRELGRVVEASNLHSAVISSVNTGILPMDAGGDFNMHYIIDHIFNEYLRLDKSK